MNGYQYFNDKTKNGEIISVANIVDIWKQVLQGLEYAHRRGIFHRDIKPANLFRTEDGTVKIIDFGIAGVRDSQPDKQLTQSGIAMGTPEFQAPELYYHFRFPDARSDLFSLGCTIYFLLCGQFPYENPDKPHSGAMSESMPYCHRKARSVRPDLPKKTGKCLDRMIAFDPAQRPASCREVLETLRREASVFRSRLRRFAYFTAIASLLLVMFRVCVLYVLPGMSADSEKPLPNNERETFARQDDELIPVKAESASFTETSLSDYREKFMTAQTREQLFSKHADPSGIAVSEPTRALRPLESTIRLTLEILADGTGRFLSERGKTTDAPPGDFGGTRFSFSESSTLQAFHGNNGMSRVFFDFYYRDHKAVLNRWLSWERNVAFNAERFSLCLTPTNVNTASMGIRKWRLPCKVTIELLEPLFRTPSFTFQLIKSDGTGTFITLWSEISADQMQTDGYYFFSSDITQRFYFRNNAVDGMVSSQRYFQLPRKSVEDIRIVEMKLVVGQSGLQDNIVDVSYIDITGDFLGSTGIVIDGRNGRLIVEEIQLDSSAFRAGLKKNDVIVRFNDIEETTEQIQHAIENVSFGDPITMTVLRDGEEKELRFHAE